MHDPLPDCIAVGFLYAKKDAENADSSTKNVVSTRDLW